MELSGLRGIRWFALGGLGLALVVAVLVWPRSTPDAEARPAPVAPTGLVVEVRNASTRAGMARLVTRLLREKGVDVIYFGTAGKTVDSTTILVRRGDLARGEQLAKLLGRGLVRMAPDSLLRLDATILIGADYQLPKDRFPL